MGRPARLGVLLGAVAAIGSAGVRGVCGEMEDGAAVGRDALRGVVERGWLGQLWGGAVVVRGGEVVMAEGFGLRDEGGEPIDGRTLFDIGSVSKQFTAAAVLVLRDEGRLSLDDTVDRFFPEAGGASDRITVRHLLGHTSGLSDRAALQRLDYPDRDGAVGIAMRSALVSEPGEAMSYANVGYVVLAAVVEVASGRRFEGFVRERVFAPAGMGSSGFIDGEGLDPERFSVRERGVRHGRAQRVGLTDDGWGWGLRGAGGVVTCAEDLGAWARALREGRVLGEASTAEMLEAGAGGCAMGWFVERTARGTRRAHHAGGTRGYRSEVVWLVDEDAFIGVMTNERWDPVRVARRLEAALFPSEAERVEAWMRVGSAELNRWGAATVEGVGVRVEVGEGGVGEGCEVVVEIDGGECVRVALNGPAARRLGAELEGLIEAGVGERDASKLIVATRKYENDGERVRFGEGLGLWVLPAYRGREVDEGPTVVVVDEARSMWPVIVMLGASDAEGVVEAVGSGEVGR